MIYFVSTRLFNRNIAVAAILALLLLTIVVSQTTAQGLADPRFDLTDNEVIDDADAAMVLQALALLQEEGLCILPELANRDINGDGCVDIFDAQIILSHWGERTSPEPSLPLIVPAAGTTFIVNSSGDSPDASSGDNVCNTGNTVTVNGNAEPECTLRAALKQSNVSSGRETIEFDVRNTNGSCPSLITINTISNSLIIDAPDNAGVTIDGYSQCGASPNTKAIQGNAVIKIEIKGPRTSGSTGLAIYSSHNTMRGLAIYRSRENVLISGPDATNNTIQGNIIGSNADLSWGSYGKGVSLRDDASYNLVGGIAYKERNILGGFDGDGIPVRDWNVDFNVIIGNYIGVKQDGKTKARANGDGIDIQGGPRYNWVGASPPGWIAPGANSSSAENWPPPGAGWPPEGWKKGDPLPSPDPNRVYNEGERNVIAGTSDGVEVTHGVNTQYNYIVNNYIGVDASGTRAVGNRGRGINLEDQINHHFIYNNVIVASGDSGIEAFIASNYHQIVNNYIGVAPDGITPMGNGTNPEENFRYAIYLYGGTQHVLIKNNIIANHPKHAIVLSTRYGWRELSHETYFNTISQNSIYNNGGEEFGGKGINLVSHAPGWYANQGIPAPVINSASQALVEGTGCPACTIEVFIAQVNDSFDLGGGEGKTYLATGTTDAGGNFSIPISGTSVGDKVTATATDMLGNTSEFGNNVEVSDGQIPIGTVLLNGGTNLQSAYTDVLAEFWAVDNVSVTHWRYQVDNPDLSGVSWTATPGGTLFEDDIVLSLSEGFHTIYAQYKDADENVSVVYNATITIVNVGNPSNLPNGAITINNGNLYTNNPDLSLQLISPPPPFYTKDMKIGENSNLNGSGWEPYTVQTVWTLDNPPNQSQTVNMYARFRDVDNTQTPSIVNDDILYDPVTPTLSVSINAVNKILDLSGSQDDAGGSGLGQMRIYNGAYNSGWIPYQTTFLWEGPDDTIINVKLRDNAGNETAMSSVTLPSPDGTPVGTILLNGGTGLQSTGGDVVAQFEAQDDNAVAWWRYQVDNLIPDDPDLPPSWIEISSPGPTFLTSVILSLDDGFHTVYAQYQDDTGKVSPVYFATITIGDSPAGGGIYLPVILR